MSAETALPEALNHFAAALSESTQASHDLSSAVLSSEEVRRKRTILLALATAAIAIMIILNLVLAVAALSTQAAIKDCTDPAGKCAQRGQQSTAVAVGAIIQGQYVATWVINRCQLESSKPADFTVCVDRDLKAIKDGTLKAPQLPQ